MVVEVVDMWTISCNSTFREIRAESADMKVTLEGNDEQHFVMPLRGFLVILPLAFAPFTSHFLGRAQLKLVGVACTTRPWFLDFGNNWGDNGSLVWCFEHNSTQQEHYIVIVEWFIFHYLLLLSHSRFVAASLKEYFTVFRTANDARQNWMAAKH